MALLHAMLSCTLIGKAIPYGQPSSSLCITWYENFVRGSLMGHQKQSLDKT